MSSSLTKLQQILGADRALGGREAIEPYARDESGLGAFYPDAVGVLESTEEAFEVLRLAALDRIPITPRGLGSGKSGGALAVEGGIVLSTERLQRVREIDEGNRLAVVEPGVITGRLQQVVRAEGLFYPPDPASLDICSIGGNVAENAGGPRAFKYGVTRDYVLGLKLGLIGGEQLALGRRSSKGVTGLDVTGLVVGSEGTLGLITEVTLRLLPHPAACATFLARFEDVQTAGRAVAAMVREGHHPAVLELLDTHVVEHLRADGRWPLPAQRCALLMVELDGDAMLVERQMLSAADACERAGAAEVMVATDERRRRQMWDMRRNVSPVLAERHRCKVSEDIAVPPAAIAEMLRRLDALAAEQRLEIAAYGHAGDGNLHVNLLVDDEASRDALEGVIEQIFRHALDLGGTLSGEHGIGIAKRRFMALEQSGPLLALQRQLKHAFDPQGLMNPGKLLP